MEIQGVMCCFHPLDATNITSMGQPLCMAALQAQMPFSLLKAELRSKVWTNRYE